MSIILHANQGPGGAQNWGLFSAEVDSDLHTFVTFRPSANREVAGSASRIASVTGSLTFPFPAVSGIMLWGTIWQGLAPYYAKIRRVRIGAIVSSAVTTSLTVEARLFLWRQGTVGWGGNLTTSTTVNGDDNRLYSGAPSQASSSALSLANNMVTASSTPTTPGTTGWTVGQTAYVGNLSQLLGSAHGASGTAVGTNIFSTQGTGLQPLFDLDTEDQYPIILGYGDGLWIDNGTAGPATGAATFCIEVDWMEVIVP